MRAYLRVSGGFTQEQTDQAFDGLLRLGGYSTAAWEDVKLRTAVPRALAFLVSGRGLNTIGSRALTLGAGTAAVRLTKLDFPEVAAQISQQKQFRHLSGGAAGGYMRNLNDAQAVLNAYHAGDAIILGRSAQGFPVVRVPGVTGINVNRAARVTNQVTNVFMIKGTVRPSIVPVTPTWRPR